MKTINFTNAQNEIITELCNTNDGACYSEPGNLDLDSARDLVAAGWISLDFDFESGEFIAVLTDNYYHAVGLDPAEYRHDQ